MPDIQLIRIRAFVRQHDNLPEEPHRESIERVLSRALALESDLTHVAQQLSQPHVLAGCDRSALGDLMETLQAMQVTARCLLRQAGCASGEAATRRN